MEQTETLFKNGRIINGLGRVWETGWVLVKGQLIQDMGEGNFPGEGEPKNVVDLEGGTLLPGLIDAHVHMSLDGSPDPMNKLVNTSLPLVTLQTARHARQTLEAGVTTVRDLGCRDFIDLAFREAIGSGLAEGPRMLCAGQMICITGGHGWQIGCEADGPDQVRQAVRLQAKAGVDLVKFMVTGGVLTRNGRPGVPQLTVEETTAGVEEAHKAGLKTAAHVQSLEGVRNAVAAGIDSLEHCVGLDDEIIERMVKQGTFAVPTLSAPFNILEAGAESGFPGVHRQDRAAGPDPRGRSGQGQKGRGQNRHGHGRGHALQRPRTQRGRAGPAGQDRVQPPGGGDLRHLHHGRAAGSGRRYRGRGPGQTGRPADRGRQPPGRPDPAGRPGPYQGRVQIRDKVR